MGSVDTYRCCTCGGTLCEVAVFCYNEFRSGGYLWLSNGCTVTVAQLWEVFRLFAVVLGLILV